jgi:antitoxin MazE
MPESTIVKWGNSLGIRIPSSIIREAGLRQNQKVRIVVEKDGSLVICPASGEVPSLEELLARVNPEKHGGEVMAWEPVGEEVF